MKALLQFLTLAHRRFVALGVDRIQSIQHGSDMTQYVFRCGSRQLTLTMKEEELGNGPRTR